MFPLVRPRSTWKPLTNNPADLINICPTLTSSFLTRKHSSADPGTSIITNWSKDLDSRRLIIGNGTALVRFEFGWVWGFTVTILKVQQVKFHTFYCVPSNKACRTKSTERPLPQPHCRTAVCRRAVSNCPPCLRPGPWICDRGGSLSFMDGAAAHQSLFPILPSITHYDDTFARMPILW
jgi:hypothetical protein